MWIRGWSVLLRPLLARRDSLAANRAVAGDHDLKLANPTQIRPLSICQTLVRLKHSCESDIIFANVSLQYFMREVHLNCLRVCTVCLFLRFSWGQWVFSLDQPVDYGASRPWRAG